MKIILRSSLSFLILFMISCNDGRFVSPGIRSNIYLKENLRSSSPIDNKIFVKAVRLNPDNFESIKEDANNYTDTKVTKEEVEKLFNLDLKSRIGFLLIIGSRRRDSKSELVNLSVEPKLSDCLPAEKIVFPYTFIVFDRLDLGILRPHIFAYPKYPSESYSWQYEPTASNVDIWTKETLRVLIFFPESCFSQKNIPLIVEISDQEKNKNSYSFNIIR
ncbi:hypothetical protein [Leptospira stimsonii]|uniref:Lipoprotein n=1 Tax=Leptospira stimsonii TaxID=2202203 RepID=A0A396YKS2_9LEPT|nr:hypothetical protein [Leptospira stimsonii]RHX83659.1 hypothetical protein DLM75_23670 [Leptospira stimsonii]